MLKRLASLALFACAPLYAAPHLDDQRLQHLANDPFWLSLGHYEAGKLKGWRSYVSDAKFFLAKAAYVPMKGLIIEANYGFNAQDMGGKKMDNMFLLKATAYIK